MAMRGFRDYGSPGSSKVSDPTSGPAVAAGTSAAMAEAVAQYAPDGGYGKGVEAALDRGRTQAVAGGTQALVSSGLMGTTMPAGLAKKFEEEVGMPARAQVEENRASAIAGLKSLEAQVIQGATEASRARAMEQYIAKLSATTSLQTTGMQTGTQKSIASGQLQLGYAELNANRQIAMDQIASQADSSGGAYDSGGYIDVGSSYGGGYSGSYSAPAPTQAPAAPAPAPASSSFRGSGYTGSW